MKIGVDQIQLTHTELPCIESFSTCIVSIAIFFIIQVMSMESYNMDVCRLCVEYVEQSNYVLSNWINQYGSYVHKYSLENLVGNNWIYK